MFSCQCHCAYLNITKLASINGPSIHYPFFKPRIHGVEGLEDAGVSQRLAGNLEGVAQEQLEQQGATFWFRSS